jgi:chromosome segregation protein
MRKPEWSRRTPDPALACAALDATHIATVEARTGKAVAQRRQIGREAEVRRARLGRSRSSSALAPTWRTRHRSARCLRANGPRKIAGLAARPTEIATESEALTDALAEAAANCRRSSDSLASGETRLREVTENSRLTEQALAEVRERRARFEVLRDGANEVLVSLAREIRERVDATPEALAELAGLAADEMPPDPTGTSARLDRLIRERDGIGPVNLMAESEAAETEARVAGCGTSVLN